MKFLLVVLFIVPVLLLSACDGNKMLSHEEIAEKLANAGYEITQSFDQEEIDKELLKLINNYNIEQQENYPNDYETLELNDFKVVSLLGAKKGELYGYYFYVEDSATAHNVFKCVTSSINLEYLNLPSSMANHSQNFCYVMSIEINDILNLD